MKQFTFVFAILIACMVPAVNVCAQGREMTEEEKREMREWVKRGSRTETTVSRPARDSAVDWEQVARNPATWLFVCILILCVFAWRELNGMQESVNELDRINQREKEIWNEDVEREIERERRGETKGPKDPELAAWWEAEKRRRR